MRVKFIGATNHITGSCSWLQYKKTNTQFLVDCGMHQGRSVERRNLEEFPFDPHDIDFMFLTHAHLDHCGLIPKLYKQGFKGKVYTTSATAKLAKIVLNDSAKISEQNGADLYSKEDVDLIDFFAVDIDPRFTWGQIIPISRGIRASFIMSSHILGASSISMSWFEDTDINDDSKSKTMVFSGDIGNNTDELSYLPLLKANKYPFPATNYILVESTYGGRPREKQFKSRDNRLEALDKILTDTIYEKKGKAIIPTFSIHRSQEILIDMVAWLNTKGNSEDSRGKDSQKIKVLCQSPMIAKTCQVYFEELNKKIQTRKGEKNQYLSKSFINHINNDDFFDKKFGFLFNTINEKEKTPSSRLVVGNAVIHVKTKRPTNPDNYDIILSSSGMCEAGPICDYLDLYENDPNNTIILTGYQSPDSRGAQLLQKAETDSARSYAEIINFSGYYSGHADQDILLDYIFNIGRFTKERTSTTVFINHGEPTSKETLKSAIEEKNATGNNEQRPIKDVLIAESSSWFNLDAEEYEAEEELMDIDIPTAEIYKEMKSIKRMLRELTLTNQRLLKRLDSKK